MEHTPSPENVSNIVTVRVTRHCIGEPKTRNICGYFDHSMLDNSVLPLCEKTIQWISIAIPKKLSCRR